MKERKMHDGRNTSASYRICSSTGGAALVITLSLLVLVTTLILTLFLAVSNERTESSASANQGNALHLADTVVGLVKSTITQATSGYEANADGTPMKANPTAWASQPGLIRTWKQDGTPDRSFRLYSSGNIITTGSLALSAEQSSLTNWKSGTPSNSTNSYNALWCDLNAPALNQSGERIYPIVTPPKDANSDANNATDPNYGVPTDTPGGNPQTGVQGFAVTNPPGYSGSGPTSINNPAPMPVKWLYILQDGSFVTPPSGSGANATVSGATSSNPIVGRIAYWTDDETCKVNINTASEGAAWDIPRAEGLEERHLGQNQPVRNEYQRFPGHPAMTSLSAVFPTFGNLAKSNWNSIYDILPKMGWPGSAAGTVQPNPGTSTIIPKNNRLFASADELLFTPALSGTQRTEQTLLSGSTIKVSKFFLTTNSRAPETTLFETPRISLWPLNTQTTKQDAFDKTLAFCGTVNSNQYYFQRQNSLSNTEDWAKIQRNQVLYAYLQNLTYLPIPGFGGDFKTKYGADRDQILTFIFDYIRSGPNLMSVNLPGAAAATKFSNGFAAGLYTQYSGTVMPIQIGTTRGFGRAISISEVALAFYAEGISLITGSGSTPSRAQYNIRPYLLLKTFSPTPGWGCFEPQLSVRIKSGLPSIMPAGSGSSALGTQLVDFPVNQPCQTIDRPSNINDSDPNNGSIFSPQAFMLGNNSTSSTAILRSGNVNDPKNILLRSSAAYSFTYPMPFISGTGTIAFTGTQVIPTSGTMVFAENDDTNGNKWLTGYRTTQDPNLRFDLIPNGPLTLELLNPNDNTVMQTLSVNIPTNATSSSGSPSLRLPLPFYRVQSGALSTNTTWMNDVIQRGKLWGNNANWHSQAGDVIRGLEISGNSGPCGDSRLVFAQTTIPAAWFQPVNNDYLLKGATSGSSAVMLSHALRGVFGSANTTYDAQGHSKPTVALNSTSGLLVQGTQFVTGGFKTGFGYDVNADNRPVPASLNGAVMQNGKPGDWDNLSGTRPDGPFINKPDEGGLGQLNTLATPQRWSYYNALNIGTTDAQGVNDANQFALIYSPNREMYSAFQLGSLPSRAVAGNPWETLLFNPVPAAADSNGNITHRGWASPRDHLLADLFWMPIVDPYPMSEPLSTAGKINLNAAIAPFGYIRRETGLHALLKSVQIAAFDTRPASPTVTSATGLAYKGYALAFNSTATPPSQNFRYDIDRENTLAGMRDHGGFRSATEIAEVRLYPAGQGLSYSSGASGYSSLYNWWVNQKMTGDNTREMPYAQLLPRVTTKSNTFTVHMRVQMLKQVSSGRSTATDWQKWDETKDQVVSEYRGSATIERYVDPNDATIPDFAQPANFSKNLAPYYRWRVLQKRQFVP